MTVGTGGDFESLSNPGGLFEQLSEGTLLGDVTVNIISDLPGETGTIHWMHGLKMPVDLIR